MKIFKEKPTQKNKTAGTVIYNFIPRETARDIHRISALRILNAALFFILLTTLGHQGGMYVETLRRTEMRGYLSSDTQAIEAEIQKQITGANAESTTFRTLMKNVPLLVRYGRENSPDIVAELIQVTEPFFSLPVESVIVKPELPGASFVVTFVPGGETVDPEWQTIRSSVARINLMGYETSLDGLFPGVDAPEETAFRGNMNMGPMPNAIRGQKGTMPNKKTPVRGSPRK